MLIAEKSYFMRSSIPLSIFWPLMTVATLPNFKVEIEALIDNFDFSRLVLTSTLLPSCILLSLANLWPDIGDLDTKDKKYAPNNTNSFLSSVFLSWLTPLIWKGYKSPLTQEDLYSIPRKIDIDDNVRMFLNEWNKHLSRSGIAFDRGTVKKSVKRAKLWLPLVKTLGLRFLLANLLALVHYSITFLGPQVF